MSGVRLDGTRIAQALSTFARDAWSFLLDNPGLPVGLVVLAIVVFGITRPRVR
jgi:hypothetical protein